MNLSPIPVTPIAAIDVITTEATLRDLKIFVLKFRKDWQVDIWGDTFIVFKVNANRYCLENGIISKFQTEPIPAVVMESEISEITYIIKSFNRYNPDKYIYLND